MPKFIFLFLLSFPLLAQEITSVRQGYNLAATQELIKLVMSNKRHNLEKELMDKSAALVEAGADPAAMVDENRNLFFAVYRLQFYTALSKFIELDPGVLNLTDAAGQSLAFELIANSAADPTDFWCHLVKEGADLNLKNKNGRSSFLELLVTNGGEDRRGRDRYEALRDDTIHPSYDVLTALLGLQFHGGLAEIGCKKQILENPLDVTASDPQGLTPLIVAADKFGPLMVALILDKVPAARKRAYINQVALDGFGGPYSALDIAIASKNMGVFYYLLSQGADALEERTLQRAIRHNAEAYMVLVSLRQETFKYVMPAMDHEKDNFWQMKQMINANASLPWLLTQNLFPDLSAESELLGEAIDSHKSYLIPFLIDSKASPYVTDRNGDTPLMTAVLEGDSISVRWLLARMDQIDQKNKEGKTALDLAKKLPSYHDPETIVQLLLAH